MMPKKISSVKKYKFLSLDKNLYKPEIERDNILNDSFVVEKNNSFVEEEIAFAEKNDFDISPITKEKRGINDYKIVKDKECFEQELEKRLRDIREKAYQEGYEEGKEKGVKDVYDRVRAEAEEKLEAFTEIINEVLEIRNQLIWKEKKQIYDVIKTLTKWIILRELEYDEHYMERLLECLVLEIQTKSGLFVQVNKKHFDKMPEIIQSVEKKIGNLENVRVEVSSDIEDDKGIIVSCENGIINGTLEEQLKGLDKIFEKVDEVNLSRNS